MSHRFIVYSIILILLYYGFTLKNNAIISLNKYQELKILEPNKNIVINELKNIILSKEWLPYDFFHKEKIIAKSYDKITMENIISKYNKSYIDSNNKPSWLVFILIYNSYVLNDALKYFPNTIKLLSKIKGITAAGISCLEGGGYIPPHNDEGIERYKFHLPLIIPDNCGIKINGSIYDFDKPLIFDDTYQHSVWNYSNKPRFVLIIDILRK